MYPESEKVKISNDDCKEAFHCNNNPTTSSVRPKAVRSDLTPHY